MAIQVEKFKEIADAIRIKTRNTENIVADNFASEIMTIDRLTPMTEYDAELSCGYYGNRVAKIAASYLLARALGEDEFYYNQTTNIFASNTSLTKTVRNSDGVGQIDCSTFVSLVLRGISYEKSPYALHKGADATWTPSTELSNMYGTDGWEFRIIDKQPEGIFNNIGISGYSTIKSAADLGEFFYKYGYVIFDSKIDGEMTSSKAESLMSELKPGDLLFWSKPTATDTQKKRFRSISHIAIVSENTTNFIEVTTGDLVVVYSKFISNYDNIGLICRPDYRPRGNAEETPLGVNLLQYPWTYGALVTSTSDGITFTIKDANTINLYGVNTAQIFHRLKGSENSGTYLTLSAGTYKLSGMDNVGITDSSVALQIRNADGTDFYEKIRCYTGNEPTFTLSSSTNIIVVLYISESNTYTLNCDITPTLIRLS